MNSEKAQSNREKFVEEREKRAEERSKYEKQQGPFDTFETMKELWGKFVMDTSTEEDIAFEEALKIDEKLEEMINSEEEYQDIHTYSEALEELKKSNEYEKFFGHQQETEIANEEFIRALGNKLEQLLENNNFELAQQLVESVGGSDWLARGKVEPTEEVSDLQTIEKEINQELYSTIQKQIKNKIDNIHQLNGEDKTNKERLLSQLETFLDSLAPFIVDQIDKDNELKQFIDNIEPESFGSSKEEDSKRDFWRSQDEEIARKLKKFRIPVRYNDSHIPDEGAFNTSFNILDAYDAIFNDTSENECSIIADIEEVDEISTAKRVGFYN